MKRHELELPELGIDDVPIRLSLWLVEEGALVSEGDPVVEILAGAATVDLPAPADGRLAETLASEDDELEVGQTLAVIESDD